MARDFFRNGDPRQAEILMIEALRGIDTPIDEGRYAILLICLALPYLCRTFLTSARGHDPPRPASSREEA
jgi:hypothetical protein